MKRITKTNNILLSLIKDLKIASTKNKANIWKSVIKELLKPTRKMREVNLEKINRITKENDVVIVPGKVLGSGSLDHNVTVAAFNFSESAKKKLEKYLSIHELVKKNPKGTGVRIIA